MNSDQVQHLLDTVDRLSSSLDALGVMLFIVLGILVALILTSRR